MKGGEDGEGKRGERFQLSNGVYIPPVEATDDCSVIHVGRQAQKNAHTPFISSHTLCTVTHTHTGAHTHKERVLKLISTPPRSNVCPIRCHIITLCMIILSNLAILNMHLTRSTFIC